VHHQPNIGFVDAHTESAGGHHDVDLIPKEIIECRGSPGLGQTGMVRRRSVPSLAQRACYGFSGAPGRRVHDRHDVITPKQLEQCTQAVSLGVHRHDTKPEIGAVEGPQVEGVAAPKPQRPCDLAANAGGGAAGEGYGLRLSQPVTSSGEPSVARSKIVPPLGDAVGLIHHQQAGTYVPGLQLQTEPVEPLGRDVEQAQLAGAD
jgi:hypothetical protein